VSELDVNFPSGPWTGFFTYNLIPGKTRTDLILEFADGRITGEGNDTIGPFVIAGEYDVNTKECLWRKSYVGQHDVVYQGFREGKGIWGTWEVYNDWRGGFHIWPLTEEHGTLEADETSQPKPIDVFAPAALAGPRQVLDRRSTRMPAGSL
jgi:hypothetical protein